MNLEEMCLECCYRDIGRIVCVLLWAFAYQATSRERAVVIESHLSYSGPLEVLLSSVCMCVCMCLFGSGQGGMKGGPATVLRPNKDVGLVFRRAQLEKQS